MFTKLEEESSVDAGGNEGKKGLPLPAVIALIGGAVAVATAVTTAIIVSKKKKK